MTSGEFTAFPISKIWVDRSKRQRLALEDIDDMAGSLQRAGQINPILIKRDGELVCGERRFEGAKKLGWTSINVQFTDEIDPAELQLLELEENVRRMDLTWQEQAAAIKKYHELRAGETGWSMAKTGDALGFSTSTVSRYLGVAEAIASGDERVMEAPRLSTAVGIVERQAARVKSTVLDRIEETATGESPAESRVAPLLNADFCEWSKSYDGPRFNLIHCDFPYGVKADKHDQGAASAFGGYEDSFATYTRLIDALETSMSNVVADSAHIMFWFSMDYYQLTLDRLRSMGWTVSAFPLYWMKSDNSGILPDPSRGPRRIVETCFMGSRGDRLIVRSKSNAIAHPNTKNIHMSEKPRAVLKHFMEMFCDKNSIVLDPTCGSANALRAAESLGARKVLGLEINEEFFNRAKGAYYEEEIDL